MNNDQLIEIAAVELDEVSGGIPFIALPAVVGVIDWSQVLDQIN